MVELIALIIFVVSLGVVLLILLKKAPVLSALPQNGGSGLKKSHIVLGAENKIKNFLLASQKQLHKLLLLLKVIILKIEARVDSLLHSSRRRAQKIDRELKDKK